MPDPTLVLRSVARPWGRWQVLDAAADHKVKRLEVEPPARLSYQRHALRAEHWFVVSGSGLATIDGVERAIGVGDSVDVAVGVPHRIANAGADLLVLIEVQTGTSFVEDDIERLEDDFGRAGR